MKGDMPGVYHTETRGIWPFKFRAAAHEGADDEDAEWIIKLEQYSRFDDRWLTRAAFKLYPESISKVTREVNRCWKDRDASSNASKEDSP